VQASLLLLCKDLDILPHKMSRKVDIAFCFANCW
jgi:hypothetical protein